MRKTLNINLGGMAFIIDENAFELLHNYLESLKRKFNNAAEREEILNDIELRMAEMLSQKLASNKEVISIEDVQAIMQTMGKPEDIAGEEPAEEPSSTSTTSTTTQDMPVKTKLFRDPDDAKVGGVISGLCHYFGINDPVWVRIAVVILFFFTWGTVVLLYLLLLIIIPKANTAAEKLQMKGEPVNINTIEKEIKDAANRVGESVHKVINDENFFERLGDIIVSIFKAVFKILAAIILVIAMLCLVAVVICFASFYILGTSSYSEASRIIVDSPATITLFSFGFLFFLGTLFIAIIYSCIKTLLGQRSRVKWLTSALTALWFIGLFLLIISAGRILTNFKDDGLAKHIATLNQPPKNSSLYVLLADSNGKKITWEDVEDNNNINFNVVGGRLILNGVDFNDIDKISMGKPSLQLIPSENDSFYVEEIVTSKGRNKNDAIKNAEMAMYTLSQSDSILRLEPLFYISKSAKWRNQEMKIRIAIPQGKKVRFADNIDMLQATVKGDASYDDTYFKNTVWTVENGKVKCIEGENHQNLWGEEMNRKAEQKYKKNEEKIKNLEKEKSDEPGDDKTDKNEDF